MNKGLNLVFKESEVWVNKSQKVKSPHVSPYASHFGQYSRLLFGEEQVGAV